MRLKYHLFYIFFLIALVAFGGWKAQAVTSQPSDSLTNATQAAYTPYQVETIPGPILAKVVKVVDGDTISVRARVWLGQDIETSVRIVGVDTPEIRGKCATEKNLAQQAKQFVADTINNQEIVLVNIKRDKYGGRVIAQVQNSEGADLGTALISAGFARAYDGGKRRGWCEI